MALVNFVILLALVQYLAFGIAVGAARGRYGVEAPATSGNPEFERYFRVQMNTLELIVVFVPAMLIFGYYVSSAWAAVLGTVYLLGRVLYYYGYVAAPEKRSIGFLLSIAPIMILLVCGLYGAARLAIGF